MRIGVYSDVHANQTALKAVLAHYDTLDDIDFFACLGDVVGYGPQPDRCCDLVRPHVRFTVLGNHDAAVAGRMNYDYYYPAARDALDRHRALLQPVNLKWLKSLPYSIIHEEVCFTHGSPVNEGSFEYVFTPEHANALLDHWEELAHITVMGHSHLTKSFRLGPPDEKNRITELVGDELRLDNDAKFLITVGSVGQPRDNDVRACCTVLDTDKLTLRFHRVDYDVFGAADAIWNTDYLAPDFGKRLFLGV